MIIEPNLIALGLESSDSSGVIQTLGRLLIRAGHVKDGFINAVLEREREFPTGICTGGVNVALPHTDSVHVHKSSIAAGILARPVRFRVMGHPQEEVEVGLVVMLAIKESEAQITYLAKIAQLLQQPELIGRLIEADEEEDVACLLTTHILGRDPDIPG